MSEHGFKAACVTINISTKSETQFLEEKFADENEVYMYAYKFNNTSKTTSNTRLT